MYVCMVLINSVLSVFFDSVFQRGEKEEKKERESR